MRTDEEVYRALSASGIKGTHFCWPEGGAPSLPWFTYELEDDGALFADNGNFAYVPTYRASLYQKSPDRKVEEAFEKALGESFGPYTREEYFIEDENAYMTTFTFSFTGGNQNG